MSLRSRHSYGQFRMSFALSHDLTVGRLDTPAEVVVVSDEHLDGVVVIGLPAPEDGHEVVAFGRLRGSGRLAYQFRTASMS